ncbi:MAG: hypothetical protein FRX49_11080 [Trebouxia sp. A1-2]|nr:MAG: hypothetical protein FRX49_11080 [Trebouxia sp. A1-2]
MLHTLSGLQASCGIYTAHPHTLHADTRHLVPPTFVGHKGHDDNLKAGLASRHQADLLASELETAWAAIALEVQAVAAQGQATSKHLMAPSLKLRHLQFWSKQPALVVHVVDSGKEDQRHKHLIAKLQGT